MLRGIEDLSMITEIPIIGTDKKIKVDFTDMRFVNKLLKLIKRFNNINQEIDNKVSEIETITDDLDRYIAISDLMNDILEEFKNSVNNTFNSNVTDMLYGDCLPRIERYFGLFESVTPYIEEAQAKEYDAILKIREKYGIDRLSVVSPKE